MSELKEKRRTEIIEASMKVFSECGFYHGKVEDIAKEAGIGKGTVYEYFGSKKEIFQEMLMYMMEAYIEGAKGTVLREEGIRNRLIAILNYHSRFIDIHAHLIERTFFHFENILKEVKQYIQEMNKQIFDFTLQIITEGIETGELGDIDNKTATIIFLGLMNSSHLKTVIANDGSLDNIGNEDIVDMILKGLGK
ncbi:transcriptional regulator, TetR family [Tissierella praeacuta DSM 18095]|uniref:Transcriptional regulator, TetR family n=1 Tax=Tissierella praeacuta DSM 18095 TaxID=1123404 RepID=A0A1M4XTT6_9FIRM|nr:TetR/AcrR family transcriptional regulator [Tissierella praeacuta]TCU79195.1 TetR family transcriptional regulator [Tissierella praeacuta]SHE96652.1 transcriptional regulator, TetR family [Tissierella praeacuta DSM 18095]SUO99182.1 Fatty acid metabolism regulator protein [Tissierella praeacuta]